MFQWGPLYSDIISYRSKDSITKCIMFIVRLYRHGKSPSSSRWLKRQQDDYYVGQAQQLGYRCRSAFKLLEIDKKFKIFKKGNLVVDCGASPGAWTQVALERIGSGHVGKVISIDTQTMQPIDGAIIIDKSDFTLTTTQQRVREILAGKSANVVMSDMSPQVSGIHKIDHQRIIGLASSALEFSLTALIVDGIFICKLFRGADEVGFRRLLKEKFITVKEFKPKSSRSQSNEFFIICRGLRVPKERTFHDN